MPKAFTLVFLCLALCACSGTTDSGRAEGSGDVLLVMGDSLSAGYGLADPDSDGWVYHMEQSMRGDGFLVDEQTIVNASVSGETSQGGLERLPDLLEEHDPEVVIIELGANDALRRQPMAALKKNLTEMVRLSKESGARVVLVGMELPMVASFIGGGDLGDAIDQVGDALDVPVIAFPMADLMDDGLIQEDRLHPTGKGQRVIKAAIEPIVRKVMRAN